MSNREPHLRLGKLTDRMIAELRTVHNPDGQTDRRERARKLWGVATALNAIAERLCPQARIDWSKAGPH